MALGLAKLPAPGLLVGFVDGRLLGVCHSDILGRCTPRTFADIPAEKPPLIGWGWTLSFSGSPRGRENRILRPGWGGIVPKRCLILCGDSIRKLFPGTVPETWPLLPGRKATSIRQGMGLTLPGLSLRKYYQLPAQQESFQSRNGLSKLPGGMSL